MRFALSAILALAACAILSNHLSVLAIAEWGASLSHDLLETLGFKDGITPHQSTLQRLFRRLDPDALSNALTSHFARLESAKPERERPRGSQGVAIDGKAQRGRLRFDPSGCTVHALSAYLHDLGIVLAQEPIEPHPLATSLPTPGATPAPKSTEAAETAETKQPPIDKAEAELSVAPDLLRRLDWHGRVLTGDALFCQRALCKQVVDSGGDYLFIVKENQHRLHEDIRLLFDPPPGLALPLDDRREARSVDHGHGRHYDTRVLVASTDLVGYSDWPSLAQVFSLERTWREKGKTKREVRFGVTSLPKEVADADRLLELKRTHWRIENCDHYVKDVTLGEDRSLVHLGNGPSVLAMLRDLTLSLLHRAGFHTIASRLRYHSVHPNEAIALFLGQNA
jgi:predicted transposase YbfD/YdcC